MSTSTAPGIPAKEEPAVLARMEPRDKPKEKRGPKPKGKPASEENTLRSYIATFLESWRLISAFFVIGVTAGALYYFGKTPAYQTEAMVQVEEKQKGIAGLEDLSELMETKAVAETEIQIIKSRFLIGTVVDELRLQNDVAPKYFPVIGGALARRNDPEDLAPAKFGQERYAWGGERLALTKLEVPKKWLGEKLTLIARDNQRYDLLSPTGSVVANGVVGDPATAVGGAKVEITVGELVARPQTEFTVIRHHRLETIDALVDRLLVTEKGKKTGVLRLTLQGGNPELIAHIVDTTAKLYLQQNVERRSLEYQRQLEFIETHLPEVKQTLEQAEAALSAYRTKAGSLDVSMEAQAALNQAVDVEKELMGLKLQLDEAKSHFTDDHPVVQTLRDKVNRLERSRSGIDARFKTLPNADLESVRLLRDVKVSSELYVLLLNRSQELKIAKSGAIGSVRIVDEATIPIIPIAPKLSTSLVIGVVGGLVAGLLAAIARKALSIGIEDPELLEQSLDLPVYASIPHSSVQGAVALRKGRRRRASTVLAATHPTDLAVEALRSMRTSLQFALMESNNNVVAISGPSPGIGKSFVALNLAHVLAESGKRVLLVDTDLRKGHLHDYFGGERINGLSELITEGGDPSKAVRRGDLGELDFLSTGAIPRNPSELLASARYDQIVSWASKNYDVVLLDTAPILAVTDGALASQRAGTTFLVLRSGKHPLREITAAVKRLEQNKIDVKALILNDVQRGNSYAYYKYGYHYHYDYKTAKS